jgi:hypothetical protein
MEKAKIGKIANGKIWKLEKKFSKFFSCLFGRYVNQFEGLE